MTVISTHAYVVTTVIAAKESAFLDVAETKVFTDDTEALEYHDSLIDKYGEDNLVDVDFLLTSKTATFEREYTTVTVVISEYPILVKEEFYYEYSIH